MKQAALFVFPILFIVSSLFAGCEENNPANSDSLKINYGTSFGFCLGYCKQEVDLSAAEIKFTKSGWGESVKTKTCTAPIDNNEWSALVKSINYSEFARLEEVIGCPDCADGGSEWIEIQAEDKKHRVTFEYGHEPEEVKAYIEVLRAYKNSFKNCD